MEPLSALSVAAAVVQFAEFGFKLLKKADEIRKSPHGQTQETTDLSAIASDLSRLISEADIMLPRQLKEAQGMVARDIFARVCVDCKEVNDSLQSIISKLRAKRGGQMSWTFSSFAIAVRTVANADEVDRLKGRLGEIRMQAMLTLMCLQLGEAPHYKDNLSLFLETQQQLEKQLESNTQAIRDFGTQFTSYTSNGSSQTDELVRYILSGKCDQKIWRDFYNFPEGAESPMLVNPMHLEMVLKDLYFDSMRHRESEIPGQFPETFEWMFEEPRVLSDGDDPDQQNLTYWHSFPQWLSSVDSRDIYWIKGKPGAGKSTLTKSLAQDPGPRLLRHCEPWSGGECKVIVAKYFAWAATSNSLRRSIEGLLRTVLHEVICTSGLKQALVSRLFPGRLFVQTYFEGKVSLPEFSFDELSAAFTSLLDETDRGTFKLIIFIDGLDEFDGDHRELATFIRQINAKPGIKICTSSRAWNTFKDEFSSGPLVEVERFNLKDIQMFVHQKLQSSRGFREFQATKHGLALQIQRDIVSKSNGVFLWVDVVIGLLEKCFEQGAKPHEILKLVSGLPPKLTALYDLMWERTDEKYRQDAAHYYAVMEAFARNSMTPYCLTLYFGDDDVDINDFQEPTITSDFIRNAVASVNRLLSSRTGGLLEVDMDDYQATQDSYIRYMHRTGADWVTSNRDKILACSNSTSNPAVTILKGEVLRLTACLPGPSETQPREALDSVAQLLLVAIETGVITESHTRTLVQALDHLDWHISHTGKDASGSAQPAIPRPRAAPTASPGRPRGRPKKDSLIQPGSTEHWSDTKRFNASYRRPRNRGRRRRSEPGHWSKCDSLLGLALQIPIVPYVQWKAEHESHVFTDDQSTLGPTGGNHLMEILLLSHLDIYGNPLGHPITLSHDREPGVDENETQRLQLLSHILQHVKFPHANIRSLQQTLQDAANKDVGPSARYFDRITALMDRYLAGMDGFERGPGNAPPESWPSGKARDHVKLPGAMQEDDAIVVAHDSAADIRERPGCFGMIRRLLGMR